ncbi:3-hydroxybutyrate dehydrogenase [Staphylococcus xylosus]|uniref:3-hydroxybutyrate dehydrogenase n=1 Tax=Staphylococcus xylosus TaxID=1288 RepID=UPI000D1D4FD0|nr:3-hydroxybutyrate dehydrogenase [Staphylococcus xylosus]PTH99615.1 3-hydroxybutyrate dehydrogenase [Staphylococcus xylosus]
MVKDKVTIITGAASGIGLGIAKVFLENGAKVVLADLDQDKLIEERDKLKAQGYDCIAIQVDVTDETAMKSMIEKTVSYYGRLDIMFNNAGLQHVESIESFPTEKFRQMIDIMLTGSFIGTKYALPIMKQQKFGRILNMASINGVIGFAGKAAYNSAKHGIIGLTKVSALETATAGITVNAICPGYIDTPLVRNQMADLAKERGVEVEQVLEEVLYPLIPQKRLLDIKDIADYALFLCSDSDSGKSVTGQAILIDGGYTVQ